MTAHNGALVDPQKLAAFRATMGQFKLHRGDPERSIAGDNCFNMADEGILIQPPPPPWWKRISVERWLGIGALVIALASAGFTGWYAREAHRMAEITEQARLDARAALDAQVLDVQRSRKAAEDSATAAGKLASAAEQNAIAAQRSATASEESLILGRQQLSITHDAVVAQNRPLLELVDISHVQPHRFTYLLRNSGKNTAVDIRFNCWFELWRDYVSHHDTPPRNFKLEQWDTWHMKVYESNHSGYMRVPNLASTSTWTGLEGNLNIDGELIEVRII
jgi:hypothetical protein